MTILELSRCRCCHLTIDNSGSVGRLRTVILMDKIL